MLDAISYMGAQLPSSRVRLVVVPPATLLAVLLPRLAVVPRSTRIGTARDFSFHDLKNRSAIHMATHTTRAISRGAGEEESVSLVLLRQLRDLLQVKHLAQRHAP